MNENLQMLVICIPFMAYGLGLLHGLCGGNDSSDAYTTSLVFGILLGIVGLIGTIIALVGGFVQGVQS